MATQRYISTSFWDDRWIRSLNPSDRYLYLYLMTNPLTNIAGVYEITIDRIAFDTGYDERALKPMLDKFAEAGKAYHYNDEWMILPSWPEHQQWERRSKIKDGIVAILKKLPSDLLGYMVEIGYRYPIDTLSVPYTYPPNYSDSDSDSDSDTSPPTNSEPSKKYQHTLTDGDTVPIGRTTYDRLCQTYGKDQVDAYIERAYAYAVGTRGKKGYYKDYALAAENYMKRDDVKPKGVSQFAPPELDEEEAEFRREMRERMYGA